MPQIFVKSVSTIGNLDHNQIQQVLAKAHRLFLMFCSSAFSRLGVATAVNLHFFNTAFVFYGRMLFLSLILSSEEKLGTCLPHKSGGDLLSALPKDPTSELAGLFSTTSLECRAPSTEAVDTILTHILLNQSILFISPS